MYTSIYQIKNDLQVVMYVTQSTLCFIILHNRIEPKFKCQYKPISVDTNKHAQIFIIIKNKKNINVIVKFNLVLDCGHTQK